MITSILYILIKIQKPNQIEDYTITTINRILSVIATKYSTGQITKTTATLKKKTEQEMHTTKSTTANPKYNDLSKDRYRKASIAPNFRSH